MRPKTVHEGAQDAILRFSRFLCHSQLEFVLFWFQGVKNQQEIGQHFVTKTNRKKTCSRIGSPFFMKRTIFDCKVLQNKSWDGGNEPRFSSFFHPWTPEGAPGAPKSAPGSPTGRNFLRFFTVFGQPWSIFW